VTAIGKEKTSRLSQINHEFLLFRAPGPGANVIKLFCP
jgi:hypothetical protein